MFGSSSIANLYFSGYSKLSLLRTFFNPIPPLFLPVGEGRLAALFLWVEHTLVPGNRVHQLLAVGEGAGYAGGIISAMLDGMRVAHAVAAQPAFADN